MKSELSSGVQLAVHDPIELGSSYLMNAGRTALKCGDGKQKGRGGLIYRGDGQTVELVSC